VEGFNEGKKVNMETETTKNTSCCYDSSCGCHTDAFSVDKMCPQCGKRLRLTGHAQRLEFRLTCSSCGYTSDLLSQEEIGELL
jgi:ribosomal protein S27AE